MLDAGRAFITAELFAAITMAQDAFMNISMPAGRHIITIASWLTAGQRHVRVSDDGGELALT